MKKILTDPKAQRAALTGAGFVARQIVKRHPVGRAALLARRGAKLVGVAGKLRGGKLP